MGARSDNKNQLKCCKPEFIDFNFHKPNFDLHLKIVSEIQPKYAVAPDIFKIEDIENTLKQAEKLKEYADNVIIVPKEKEFIQYIPIDYIIGYSVPTKYGKANYTYDLLKGRKIHLLGGGVKKQYNIWKDIKEDIVSIDGNAFAVSANYGRHFSAELEKDETKYVGKQNIISRDELMVLSIINIKKFWDKKLIEYKGE